MSYVLWFSPNHTSMKYSCLIKKSNRITLAYLVYIHCHPIHGIVHFGRIWRLDSWYWLMSERYLFECRPWLEWSGVNKVIIRYDGLLDIISCWDVNMRWVFNWMGALEAEKQTISERLWVHWTTCKWTSTNVWILVCSKCVFERI